ncbi:hypothetical protein PVAP13_6KG158706 [Panicum virgatum]|uniref:Uncharacterized protein n=1 Tax=Panicum virgatum TaxID=38727 RepID=A0A8T0RD42_PANVG|nr:hypothetical protein PVAP13_6KG158706 [Panicum virgatum]KAG2582730.1 hypothetical protein PVAP13_6KG158706 [Panicum virgatum]
MRRGLIIKTLWVLLQTNSSSALNDPGHQALVSLQAGACFQWESIKFVISTFWGR